MAKAIQHFLRKGYNIMRKIAYTIKWVAKILYYILVFYGPGVLMGFINDELDGMIIILGPIVSIICYGSIYLICLVSFYLVIGIYSVIKYYIKWLIA